MSTLCYGQLNLKVVGSIPPSPHLEVSLGKTLNLKLTLNYHPGVEIQYCMCMIEKQVKYEV